MIKNEIAAKYSQALFQLGKEHDELAVLREEINGIWKVINENDELKNVLFHQRILPDEKKKVLSEVFADDINPHVLNFMRLLIDKRREYFLEFIIKEFNDLVNKDENILTVKVTSAVTLKDDLLQKIRDKLDDILDYEIIIEKEQDPSILGGLVIQIGNRKIDGSIKRRLENIKDSIDRIPISKLGV